jgi:hypothetical protein
VLTDEPQEVPRLWTPPFAVRKCFDIKQSSVCVLASPRTDQKSSFPQLGQSRLFPWFGGKGFLFQITPVFGSTVYKIVPNRWI